VGFVKKKWRERAGPAEENRPKIGLRLEIFFLIFQTFSISRFESNSKLI
jgi:hypothetical protein